MAIQELILDGVADLPQKETLKRITARLWADPDVVALWLGGSFARGAADEHSDIDLRVALRPEAVARWQEPGVSAPKLSALLSETVVGTHSLRWEGTVLHQALLADGVIFDLLLQSAERDPPADFTLVLGCRDTAYGELLASAELPPLEESLPADPAAISEAVTNFWIGSHKHLRMLHRNLDLLILFGLGLEQSVLIRLWYTDATGRDQSSQRPTIHTLTPTIRAVTEAVGPHSLEVIGSARTNRAEICTAIEANRNEVAVVGRRLAARLGFDYPDALEQTVRQSWQQYLQNGAAEALPITMPEFGTRIAGQEYVPRPSSYALLFNEEGRMAVMDTPRGGCLPGGGAEGDETPEETLIREVREECGWEISRLARVGEAVEYVYTPGNETGIRKECVFFRADVTAAEGEATEPDHTLVWLTPAEAETRLSHQSQVWAVRRVMQKEMEETTKKAGS